MKQKNLDSNNEALIVENSNSVWSTSIFISYQHIQSWPN